MGKVITSRSAIAARKVITSRSAIAMGNAITVRNVTVGRAPSP